MDILTIILSLVVVGLAVALFFQLRLAKQHAEDADQLLRDYQTLQKNFDSVGKGYEKALLAFDQMEEEKQTLIQVKESLLKRVQELTEAKSRLEAELQKTKE